MIGPLLEIVDKANLIHWPSLALGAAMFLVLQAVRIRKLPVPGPVIVVVLAVTLSALFDFEARGIAVVGDVPTGLPQFTLPAYSGVPVDTILLGAASIFLVSFGSGIVTARSFAARGGYEVDPNRELTGFGAANVAAGFFGAFPVTASDSRTAVNMTVGGRTQVASIAAAAALVATLLFLGPALRILPIPALGAILVAAALSLIDVEALREIRRISGVEFLFALIALMGPLSLGVLRGSSSRSVRPSSTSSTSRRIPATRCSAAFRAATVLPSCIARQRPDPSPASQSASFRATCCSSTPTYVKARLRTIASELPPGTEWFVLDASAIAQVDSTAAAMLAGIADEFAARGIALGLAEVHSEALGLLERAGVIDRIGATMVFDDLDDALRALGAAETVIEPSSG